MKITYRITENDKDKKLKDILKQNMYVSSILLRDLRESKSIYVNNEQKYNSYNVKEGDIVTIDLSDCKSKTKFKDKFKLVDKNIDILYEDEYLLIVNKPYNMPSHPSAKNYENTLSNIVASYLEKQNIHTIHIVTRLDHNTTGICIFAKHKYIQELFVRKKDIINLQKEYVAIVNGIVKDNHGIIEKNIARKQDTIILREVNENGVYAKTEYFVLNRNYDKNYTVLKVLLHTGRTHQIRVHMSNIGHVLLGDELYAKEYHVENTISKLISRQALHCNKLTFNHPITNKRIEIVCDVYDDMKKFMLDI